MHHLFRLASAVLACGVLLSLPVTASTAQPEARAGSRFPILAWVGPPAEESTPARFRELAECGFTLNFSGYPNADSAAKALDAAREAGIGLYLQMPELASDPEGTTRRFKDHPALAGYHLRDEPSAGDFPALAKWTRRIQAVDPIHPCYINLFPNYADAGQMGVATYPEYVDRFLAEVPVPYLSFDHYPVTAGGLRGNWYENLEIVARAARKAGKAFWAFALAVAHDPYPVAEVAHLRLQAFSDLAYGAQCLQYFTYWTPKSTVWNFHQAPIEDGKRTPVYDRVKQVNGEVHALARVFLGAKVVRVGHTGRLSAGTEAYRSEAPVREVRTEGAGAVASLLENGGRRYLAVVNRDYRAAMPLTVLLDGSKPVREVRKDGDSAAVGREFTRRLEPGDIAVLEWER